MVLAVSEYLGEANDVFVLDCGSSSHLNVEMCDDVWVQPNVEATESEQERNVRVTTCGKQQTIKLADAYYAEVAVHNLISYVKLVEKGARWRTEIDDV
ncbi:LOW QUALITY PROTEIN: Hypothetical protein PHPALM_19696 [Phytophthora palmivora]|uniref:Polyprotein n=1 Tax=Phytophthora palmivora TaxID=4796 RepID=A0A2P4XGQ2_9STRA|nr:LOW QUALITY PROTEIN: Hypothetical protein PHPALM_19696 [Phytophthora palmivora]